MKKIPSIQKLLEKYENALLALEKEGYFGLKMQAKHIPVTSDPLTITPEGIIFRDVYGREFRTVKKVHEDKDCITYKVIHPEKTDQFRMVKHAKIGRRFLLSEEQKKRLAINPEGTEKGLLKPFKTGLDSGFYIEPYLKLYEEVCSRVYFYCTLEEKLKLIRPMLEGLKTLHSKGFVHKNLIEQVWVEMDETDKPRSLLIGGMENVSDENEISIYTDRKLVQFLPPFDYFGFSNCLEEIKSFSPYTFSKEKLKKYNVYAISKMTLSILLGRSLPRYLPRNKKEVKELCEDYSPHTLPMKSFM